MQFVNGAGITGPLAPRTSRRRKPFTCARFAGGSGRFDLRSRRGGSRFRKTRGRFLHAALSLRAFAQPKGIRRGDLTQQTFLLWALKGHQLRDASKVKTWLFTSLYREFLGRKRQQDRFVEVESSAEAVAAQTVSASVVNQLDGEIVQRALFALDEIYRAPLTLFYLQQHSYKEIAETLEVPIGTVMSRISRGKQQLRKALADSASLTSKGEGETAAWMSNRRV